MFLSNLSSLICSTSAILQHSVEPVYVQQPAHLRMARFDCSYPPILQLPVWAQNYTSRERKRLLPKILKNRYETQPLNINTSDYCCRWHVQPLHQNISSSHFSISSLVLLTSPSTLKQQLLSATCYLGLSRFSALLLTFKRTFQL